MGWDELGREKNIPSERGTMKWRASKAKCMAITTTCVSCLARIVATFFFHPRTAFELFFYSTLIHFRFLVLGKQKREKQYV